MPQSAAADSRPLPAGQSLLGTGDLSTGIK
jgi:hypothetical protein